MLGRKVNESVKPLMLKDRGFFRVSKLAERWGWSPDTITRMINKGTMPHHRIPGVRTTLIPAEWVYEQEEAWKKEKSPDQSQGSSRAHR